MSISICLIEFKVNTSQGNKWFRWQLTSSYNDCALYTDQGSNFVYLKNSLNNNEIKKFKNSAISYDFVAYDSSWTLVNQMQLAMLLYANRPFSIERWRSTNGSSWTTESTSTYNVKKGDCYSSDYYHVFTYSSSMSSTSLYCNLEYTSAKGWNSYTITTRGPIPIYYSYNDSGYAYHNFISAQGGWQSIESITGKGKTYPLTVIKSDQIKDGYRLNNASSSAFDMFTDDSKIDNMISIALGETKDYSKVIVNYKIPTNVYEYIKLVYKKDSIPDSYSEEGAIAVDITADNTSKEIPFISDGDTYYFVIFTNSSMSEPIKFKSKRKWNGEEIAIMYRGENNKLTVQVSNDQIIFKMYTGETEIYSWISSIGTTVDDVENIYVQFIQDDTYEMAKPSFVYYNGSTYSYNQENPTDAQMQAIYTWLEG